MSRTFHPIPLILLTLAACADRYIAVDPDERDVAGREVVLHPDTVLLDDLQGVRAVAVEPDGLRVVTDAPLLLRPGNVVVGRLGGGYLRRITDVRPTAYGLWLSTVPAGLGEALLEAHVTTTIALDPYRDAAVWNLSGQTLVDQRVQGVDVLVEIDEGWASVSPTFDLTLDVWGGQTEVGFDTTVLADWQATFVARADGALDAELRRQLFVTDVPFSFWIGPVPVVGEARVALSGAVEIEASGALAQELDTWAWASAELGAGYAGGWWSSFDADWDAGVALGDTTLQGDARVRAAIEARIDASLYGLNSPYVELVPWVEASAGACAEPGDVRVDVWAGIDGQHGYDMDIWGLDALHYGPRSFGTGAWALWARECPPV